MTIHMEHPLFAEERQEEIVRLLRTKDRLTVPQLCEHFQVSAATIRNDIRKLAAEKKLKRISGGIIPFQKVGFEVSAASKAELNSHLKMKIAAKAAEFVKDGDTIILDAGTTTLELAKCLSDKKNITIVINDLSIAVSGTKQHRKHNPTKWFSAQRTAVHSRSMGHSFPEFTQCRYSFYHYKFLFFYKRVYDSGYPAGRIKKSIHCRIITDHYHVRQQ